MNLPLSLKTVLWILVFLAVSTIAAIVIVRSYEGTELSKYVQRAAITLIFGAVLGGVVKILLDDFDRRRQQRADHAQFIINVLADLKAVYDRVDRVRILLPAHQSALTLGNEMQDVIDARVQLRNVIRALETRRDPDSQSQDSEKLKEHVRVLIRAFQSIYRYIADLERVYEAQINAQLDKMDEKADPKRITKEVRRLPNRPWEELCELHEVRDFIGADSKLQCIQAGQSAQQQQYGDDYRSQFVDCLHEATKILRKQLRDILKP
jgi:hypothetical protein